MLGPQMLPRSELVESLSELPARFTFLRSGVLAHRFVSRGDPFGPIQIKLLQNRDSGTTTQPCVRRCQIRLFGLI